MKQEGLRAHAKSQRTVTDEQVRIVLTDARPAMEMARDLGINKDSIGRIRRGVTYADVHPEIPRWVDRMPIVVLADTCGSCVHFDAEGWRPCDIGMPEARSGHRSPACGSYLPVTR